MSFVICVKNELNDKRLSIGNKYSIIMEETMGNGRLSYYVRDVNVSGSSILTYASNFVSDTEYSEKQK